MPCGHPALRHRRLFARRCVRKHSSTPATLWPMGVAKSCAMYLIRFRFELRYPLPPELPLIPLVQSTLSNGDSVLLLYERRAQCACARRAIGADPCQCLQGHTHKQHKPLHHSTIAFICNPITIIYIYSFMYSQRCAKPAILHTFSSQESCLPRNLFSLHIILCDYTDTSFMGRVSISQAPLVWPYSCRRARGHIRRSGQPGASGVGIDAKATTSPGALDHYRSGQPPMYIHPFTHSHTHSLTHSQFRDR